MSIPIVWSQQAEVQSLALKPIFSVAPVYPEHLKEERIAGEVILTVFISEKGDVELFSGRAVARSLHPDLDKAAMEAVKQWKYEPILWAGKPIRIVTFVSVVFDPGEQPAVLRSCPPPGENVMAILDACWENVSKLEEKSFLYVCREHLSAKIRKLVVLGGGFIASGAPDKDGIYLKYNSSAKVPDLGEVTRKTRQNEYQLTGRANRYTELRTPIRPPKDAPGSAEEESLPGFPLSLSLPARISAPGLRSAYCYDLKKPEKILGKECDVIVFSAVDKWDSPIKSGTVWIMKEKHQVFKAEVEFNPSALDERLLAECRRWYLAPAMVVLYEYATEKSGFQYPSRTRVRVDYSRLGTTNKTNRKADIDIRYDQYRFFNVETDPKIIKTP